MREAVFCGWKIGWPCTYKPVFLCDWSLPIVADMGNRPIEKFWDIFFHSVSVFSSLKWRYNSNRGAFEEGGTCRYKLLLENQYCLLFFFFNKRCRSSTKCLSFCLLRLKNTPRKVIFFLSHFTVIKLPGYYFVCKTKLNKRKN